MVVDDPPVCSRCSEDPDSAPRLEQHVRVSKTPGTGIRVPKRLVNQAGMISLSDPLNVISSTVSNSKQLSHLTPVWMSLLPSSRKSFGNNPRQSMTNRRSTFPEYGRTQLSKPPSTPSEEVVHTSFQESHVQKSSPTGPITSPVHAPIIQSLADPQLKDNDVRKSSPLPGPWEPRGSPRLLGSIDHLPLVPDQRLRGQSSHQHVPASNHVGRSTAQNNQDIVDRNDRQSFSQQLFSRSNSLQRHRFSLRKTPTSSTIISAGSCSPEKSHSPVPSQDISPARAPLLKELSSFLATRAGK